MTYESPAVRDARIDVGAVLGAVFKRLPRIILITLLLLAAAFAFLMFQPRLYESSASILIESRGNAYTRASNESAPTNATDASVVSSQIELLKSRDTLLKVVDQLDLRSVPEFNGSAGGGFPPWR
ncbi:Wzz/FepE/Etk N-terminal domain-containing protein [Devosia sp. A8/3-2]|nr:Wzz/FepE/Etk N-terminal domain-containing protein [Devosia sp. A8/3-2]